MKSSHYDSHNRLYTCLEHYHPHNRHIKIVNSLKSTTDVKSNSNLLCLLSLTMGANLLPPKIAESDPWVMVCVDLVGPFTIKTPLKTHSLLALTIIDPATGWFEIAKANNKSAASIQDLFHNTWLA